MYGIYQIVKLKSVAIHTYIAIIYVATVFTYLVIMHPCMHVHIAM